ncbi:LytR family transcriptional regulator [Nesterenkonia salmonea]|uniref:LytR family transcriptional regulator n=1 Tax=Nesterenkonia salmonea TaxID=1804987 RepID=A0A5R9BGX7_9MICC|nr:LCP family protein [Nesterenkonia salmonea]TLP99519.1 LytR family transcriptional regulator [Nesterenkonia salmonea]
MTPTITYHEFQGQNDALRNPRSASERDRTKRACLLTLLTLLVPGGAQVTVGSRALGRIALAVTVACWFTILLGLAMYFTMRSVLLSALTQPFIMWTASLVLAALAIGWLLLWLDTFRLIRLGQLAPGLKPILVVAMVALMTLTSGGLGYASHIVNEGRQALAGIFSGGAAIPADEGRYNFLLLGADAGEGRQGLRPDSIHVVSVNQSTAETIIFSIPRNFQNAQFSEDSPMREVYPNGYNCGNECIINFLYTEVHNSYSHLYPEAEVPGVEAMMDAASGTLDLNLHGYVMVDMDGFSELIDAMGGITVESGGWVPYRGRHPETNQWGNRWFEPGTLELDGDDALSFARSREHSNDYARIQRQQCVQQAMIGQFSPQTLLTRFTEMMTAGENLVDTNLPQSQLGSLLSLAADAQDHSPQRLTLGAPDFGSSGELFSTYPDFELIHARVEELIAREGDGSEEPDSDTQDEPDTSDDQAAPEEVTEPPGPTPEHSDEAVAGDEPGEEPTPEPTELTQPDGSALTELYLIEAQQRGEVGLLEQAATGNGDCSPAE